VNCVPVIREPFQHHLFVTFVLAKELLFRDPIVTTRPKPSGWRTVLGFEPSHFLFHPFFRTPRSIRRHHKTNRPLCPPLGCDPVEKTAVWNGCLFGAKGYYGFGTMRRHDYHNGDFSRNGRARAREERCSLNSDHR
jgi:hypothetical protein